MQTSTSKTRADQAPRLVAAGELPSAGVPGRGVEAFSLIELLTAVSIMVVIIFSLYAMFNQTQKALRANITQVDVLEGGRAAAEMLGREIEQLSACNQFQTINFYATVDTIPPCDRHGDSRLAEEDSGLANKPAFGALLPGTTDKPWLATGYRVLDP